MLSILIPSYNHERFVESAIDSARAIDVPGKRIFIIDDASTDATPAAIERNLDRRGREGVTFIRKPENRGAIDSVITFLAGCDTEYVYMMASDDVAVPRGIERLVAMMQARPSLQFVIGGGKNEFEDGSTSPIYGPRHDRLFGLDHARLLRSLFLVDPSPLLCQSSVFRRSAIRDSGGFDPKLIADDYALFSKLFRLYGTRGVDFEFVPEEDCVRYRHHGSNSYRNLPRQAFSHRQVIRATAPASYRTRACGYKLAYFVLVALRRRHWRTASEIARMADVAEAPWLVAGLFTNFIQWARRG